MKFNKLYDLIVSESIEMDQLLSSVDNYDVLGFRTFNGSFNKIKVELIKFNGDYKPAIRVSLINNPKVAGSVLYNTKYDAIQAYNYLDNIVRVLKFMQDYVNEPDSYDFYNILKDENIDVLAQTGTEVSGEGGVGGSTGGGGSMGNETPGAGLPNLGGAEEIPTPTTPGAPEEIPTGAETAAPEVGGPAATPPTSEVTPPATPT